MFFHETAFQPSLCCVYYRMEMSSVWRRDVHHCHALTQMCCMGTVALNVPVRTCSEWFVMALHTHTSVFCLLKSAQAIVGWSCVGIISGHQTSWTNKNYNCVISSTLKVATKLIRGPDTCQSGIVCRLFLTDTANKWKHLCRWTV